MLAPQEIRTFFVTTSCWGRKSLFQVERNCELMLDVLATNQGKGHFQLHEFVIMPTHLHLLLTAPFEIPLETALQFIKGGFSFRIKRELGFSGEVWQAGFNEHRLKDGDDYDHHREYILQNPARAGLKNWKYLSSPGLIALDRCPEHLSLTSAKAG
jgi:putative transposase